jgi:hypothetical protein
MRRVSVDDEQAVGGWCVFDDKFNHMLEVLFREVTG